MKTAISVDDKLMERADLAAQKLGLSRSRFVADALRAHLGTLEQARITAKLNEVYSQDSTVEERRLVRALKSKLRVNR